MGGGAAFGGVVSSLPGGHGFASEQNPCPQRKGVFLELPAPGPMTPSQDGEACQCLGVHGEGKAPPVPTCSRASVLLAHSLLEPQKNKEREALTTCHLIARPTLTQGFSQQRLPQRDGGIQEKHPSASPKVTSTESELGRFQK